jgi:hypothetical protein
VLWFVPAPDGFNWPCGLTRGEKLYVRECYEPFFQAALAALEKNYAGCIFTGNPGIGKSVWLNFALVRFVQLGRRVVLQRAGKEGYWLFSKTSCCRRVGVGFPDLDLEKWRDVVYLFDPNETDASPRDTEAFTIVACSPQVKHYKKLQKSLRVEKMYFPCWSLDELRVVAGEHGLDAATLEERWLLWGGIPRYVLALNQRLWGETLDAVLISMDLRLVEAYKGNAEIADQHQKQLSHIVVQYRAEFPFTSCAIDFASPEIGLRVVAAAARADYAALMTHYWTVRQQEWHGPYAGHLWEHLCHVVIPSGSATGLPLERLNREGNGLRIAKDALEVKRGALQDLKALTDGTYFQPFAADFAVIDAAVRVRKIVYGFRFTLADNHAPKAARVLELIAALPEGTRLSLVWVVDASKNGSFALQKFLDMRDVAAKDRKLLDAVDQWRLKMTFPKENPFR